MQKIDVFTITNNKNIELRVIELKTAEDIKIHKQLERYIKWCQEYLYEATKENLQPIIVVPRISDRTYAGELSRKILPEFNENFANRCQPVKYFEFYFDEEKRIQFEKIDY